MRLFIIGLTLVTLAFGLATQAAAQARKFSYIRDTEIENAIRYYSAPIFKVAGLDVQAVRIHLVNDDRLNAFVAGGQQIFINTGLLMEADHAGQVIGVLAHETGHITGGHLAQFDENIQNAQAQSLAAMIIGVPLGLVTGRGDVASAAISLGQHVGERSLLKFTRTMEQSADQAAVKYLDGAGISSKGMVEFFETLKKNEAIYSAQQNPYTRTHPLTQDRITFVEHHLEVSRYSDKPLPESFKLIHDRVRAKLRGYMLEPRKVETYYPASDTSVPARYARAINLMRQHKTDAALSAVDRLLEESPKDPFFYELKGDILFDDGQMQPAIDTYKKTLEILPWAALIRQAVARAHIEIGGEDHLNKAVENLNEAIRYEPWATFNWRLLTTAYGRLGDRGNTALAQAEEAIRSNKTSKAKVHAKRAMDLLPHGSAGWLRAQDIEFQTRKASSEEEKKDEPED